MAGFKSRHRCHMWVEFLVVSCLCSERFFPGYSGFPSSIIVSTNVTSIAKMSHEYINMEVNDIKPDEVFLQK